ncbi:PLC-like phosphodiesterase [Pluteus cervinus]|uniref:PLC-like phosphodiesterase n=1 Tax=Pluteus cervinus TaxID=181527 RepID=A0ACD3BGB7_9AGAR|nr:PLC-like phosphodiesterase [Pluteus cervinus]
MIPSLLLVALGVYTQKSRAVPVQSLLSRPVFDVQGHRGGRGNTIENTLPSFAWGLIDGVATLELDNGITKDGVVVVWHDENITADKCKDTQPVFEGDPDYPYVGKYIANLTLAQIKTLDCGSERLPTFPIQLTYPGTRISTLQEVFDFVSCADPHHQIQWNIESKIDAQCPNLTRTVDDFVNKQHAVFKKSPYLGKITFQSFDWRSLTGMKKLESSIPTAALISTGSSATNNGARSPWQAGLDISTFPGATLGVKIANAAKSIDADILSPNFVADGSPVQDPALPGFIPFTTKDMVEQAHELGMLVKPWTVDGLNAAQQLLDWKVDGIISDYPDTIRRWAEQQGQTVSPKYDQDKVLACLAKHLETSTPK